MPLGGGMQMPRERRTISKAGFGNTGTLDFDLAMAMVLGGGRVKRAGGPEEEAVGPEE